METLQRIQDFEQLKTLTDANRLAILRLLMAAPATLSQLGQASGKHPAWIRHHVKQLESVGLVELVDTRVVRGFVEKYYRARAQAFIFQELILPYKAGRHVIPILGSHDLALEALAEHLRQKKGLEMELLALPIGSLDGLIALRQGLAPVAGCHLLDAESGEYNLPYVRHLFPDREIFLITLSHREQGLMVATGNPRRIHGLQDLAQENLTMVNRNRGSGTRLWLDYQLRQMAISPQDIRGYHREVRTHTAVAEAVSQGKADLGLGLQAAARQFGLDFIPLFQERYDLAVSKEQAQDHQLVQLFDFISSAEFRRLVKKLGGYQTGQSGSVVQMTPR